MFVTGTPFQLNFIFAGAIREGSLRSFALRVGSAHLPMLDYAGNVLIWTDTLAYFHDAPVTKKINFKTLATGHRGKVKYFIFVNFYVESLRRQ